MRGPMQGSRHTGAVHALGPVESLLLLSFATGGEPFDTRMQACGWQRAGLGIRLLERLLRCNESVQPATPQIGVLTADAQALSK